MTMTADLKATVVQDPQGLAATQAVEQLLWRCLRLAREPDEGELTEAIAEMSPAARSLQPGSGDSPEVWRAWYGGHIQAMLAMARAALSIGLPLTVRAFIGSHQNARRILTVLAEGEKNLKMIGLQTAITDASYVKREIDVLERKKLVETAKDGNERWARLTSLGRQAVAEGVALEPATRDLDIAPFQNGRQATAAAAARELLMPLTQEPANPHADVERREGERRAAIQQSPNPVRR